jgi:hypothetical protein
MLRASWDARDKQRPKLSTRRLQLDGWDLGLGATGRLRAGSGQRRAHIPPFAAFAEPIAASAATIGALSSFANSHTGGRVGAKTAVRRPSRSDIVAIRSPGSNGSLSACDRVLPVLVNHT